MKKIFLFSFLLLFLAAGHVQAAGLVPCGGAEEEACSFCHIFTLIDNILDFVLIKAVPLIAVLLMVIGGLRLFLAAGDPTKVNDAKKMIYSTVVGLFIIFIAFLVVGVILSAIGLADWTQQIYQNWWSDGFFQINC